MGPLARAHWCTLLLGSIALAACSPAPAATQPSPEVIVATPASAPAASAPPAPSAAPTSPEATASSAPGTKEIAPPAPSGDDPDDGPCLDRPKKTSAPPQLSKRKMAEALLASQAIYLHLDARRQGLTVPDYLRRRKHLVLEVGHHMAVPIPDLKVDADGISGTLSFKHQPFRCIIPWDTIYALATDEGRGGIWDRDVPADAYCP